jgi:hypothetical protein
LAAQTYVDLLALPIMGTSTTSRGSIPAG